MLVLQEQNEIDANQVKARKAVTNVDTEIKNDDFSNSTTDEAASISSSAASQPLTVDIPASSVSVVSIGTPGQLSPVVATQFVLESEKVKREAKSELNDKLEQLRKSRRDNEYRASKWAKELVEERRREISASRLMLEQMKEQRMVSLTGLQLPT